MKLNEISEPINSYINDYLRDYGSRTGSGNDYLWNTIYPSINFKTETFNKISRLPLELQKAILNLSLKQNYNSRFDPKTGVSLNCENSLRALENCNNFGILDNLLELVTENTELDFSDVQVICHPHGDKMSHEFLIFHKHCSACPIHFQL